MKTHDGFDFLVEGSCRLAHILTMNLFPSRKSDRARRGLPLWLWEQWAPWGCARCQQTAVVCSVYPVAPALGVVDFSGCQGHLGLLSQVYNLAECKRVLKRWLHVLQGVQSRHSLLVSLGYAGFPKRGLHWGEFNVRLGNTLWCEHYLGIYFWPATMAFSDCIPEWGDFVLY